MIIYSAGPDGVLQTEEGAIKVGDKEGPGDTGYGIVDYDNSDDILYKFR